MLDYSFTPAETEYRMALREIAIRELLPLYQEGDRQQSYPYEQVKRVLRFGLEFWKGREDERNLVVAGITAEEVARGDFNVVLMSLGPQYQREFLNEAPSHLIEEWMPRFATGDALVGLAITESGAGSDMAGMATRAQRKGNQFVINGAKTSVSFLNADVFYVFARTDPDSTGYQGISAFLVPRETHGLAFHPADDIGCRAVPRGVLTLQDVVVPATNMVGSEGRAFAMISHFFDINRAIIALKCVGAAMQSIEETVDHTQKREQYGRPLAANQGVQFPLAEAATNMELARWLSYRVLWMRQTGTHCQSEGAMVKWFAPKMAAEAIHKCLLFHGHVGYSTALPIQQRLRDVIGWQIGDGSEEIMKLIISRDLFSRKKATR